MVFQTTKEDMIMVTQSQYLAIKWASEFLEAALTQKRPAVHEFCLLKICHGASERQLPKSLVLVSMSLSQYCREMKWTFPETLFLCDCLAL